MKKLTILVALLMCITIGGVYATWIYSNTSASATDLELSHGLAGVSSASVPHGILKIEENSLLIRIDQTAAGNYTAKLVVTGSMTVSFTPDVAASPDIKANGIPAQAKLTLLNLEENKYGADPVYALVNDGIIDIDWGTPDSNGVFTTTISADDLDGVLDLGGTFVLSTLAQYEDFHACEEPIDLILYISEKQ